MSKILYVWPGSYPDVCVEKNVDLLKKFGKEVDVLVGHSLVEQNKKNNIYEFQDLFPKNLVKRAIKYACAYIKSDPCTFSWRYLDVLERCIREKKYECIIWDSLPGLYDATAVCRQYGVPVIFFMRENHPYNVWSTIRDIGKKKSYIQEWFEYEKLATQSCSAIIVNTEEMGQRLNGMYGIDHEKIFTIRYVEKCSDWEGIIEDNELFREYTDKIVGLYFGGLSYHRGIDTVIKAIPIVKDKIKNFKFIVVGSGVALANLNKLVSDLNVEQYVDFKGYVSFENAKQYMRIARFGIIPHHKYGQTDNTVPIKLAQYMINRLPVVVSSAHCLQRIIRETDAGLDFYSGDHKELAKKIIALLSDQDLYEKKAINAFFHATQGLFSYDNAINSFKRCLDFTICGE